ncbi:hypothetical protein CANINC_003732, partial [Pichia inconspicua]
MPDDVDGFFVGGISTTVFTDGAVTTTLTVTNSNVPQYDAVVTILAFTNPTGKTEEATCEINLTTVT